MYNFICRILKTACLMILLLLSMSIAATVSIKQVSENLIFNDGFEQIQDNQPVGWNSLCTREPTVGELRCDRQIFHSGECSVRVEHRGQKDWSLNHIRTIDLHD